MEKSTDELFAKFKESAIALIIALPAFFNVIIAQLFSVSNDVFGVPNDIVFVAFIFYYITSPIVFLIILYKQRNLGLKELSWFGLISLGILISVGGIYAGLNFFSFELPYISIFCFLVYVSLFIYIVAIKKIKIIFGSLLILSILLFCLEIYKSISYKEVFNNKPIESYRDNIAKLDKLIENSNTQKSIVYLHNALLFSEIQVIDSLLKDKNNTLATKLENNNIFLRFWSSSDSRYLKNSCAKQTSCKHICQNVLCLNFNKATCFDYCCNNYYNPAVQKLIELQNTDSTTLLESILSEPKKIYSNLYYVTAQEKIKRDYQTKFDKAQNTLLECFKSVKQLAVLSFLFYAIISLVLLVSIKPSSDDKKPQKFNKQLICLNFVLSIFLLIPMLRPINIEQIDIFNPCQSFLMQNWYLPEYIRQTVSDKPQFPPKLGNEAEIGNAIPKINELTAAIKTLSASVDSAGSKAINTALSATLALSMVDSMKIYADSTKIHAYTAKAITKRSVDSAQLLDSVIYGFKAKTDLATNAINSINKMIGEHPEKNSATLISRVNEINDTTISLTTKVKKINVALDTTTKGSSSIGNSLAGIEKKINKIK